MLHIIAPAPTGIGVASATVMAGAGFSYVRRLTGALALDAGTYEEVEADRRATPAAFATVVLSAVGTGVGMSAAGGVRGLAELVGIALLGWAVWALLVFEIGTRLLPTKLTRADIGQLLRTLGFASAPGIFNVFGIVPGLGLPILVVTQLWVLAAIVVAVRQALDYTNTRRAVGVCVFGWFVSTALVVIVGFFFGPLVR